MRYPHAETPAPGDLELVRGFVNTLDLELGTDELVEPASAAAWLVANGLDPGAGLGDRELAELVEVREALRALLAANNSGEPAPPEALETLNRRSATPTVGVRFSAEGAELVAAGGGHRAAIARLLAIVYAAIGDGTWRRLKVCPADDCRWAFYDRSRNRSGTWCEMGECGNRAKARAYRERQRTAPGR